jgi:hypothetical protein
MKQMLAILVACAVVGAAGSSHAAIGWAGQIFPTHGTVVTDNNPVDVYFQIWKGGFTDAAGQGAGISATLYHGPTNAGPWTPVAMSYNTDVGNNDEYTAAIPAAALSGNTEWWFYCEGYDSTDATTYTGAQDQASNNPPFQLNVTPVLDQDVTVTFFLCMPPEGDPEYMADPGDVCITGDHAEITNWGSGVLTTQLCNLVDPRFYSVTVLFAAGGNPVVTYKYRRNGCNDWESGANHQVTIDDSSPVYVVPWVDHWSSYVGDDCPGCTVPTESIKWGAIKALYR